MGIITYSLLRQKYKWHTITTLSVVLTLDWWLHDDAAPHKSSSLVFSLPFLLPLTLMNNDNDQKELSDKCGTRW